MQKTIGKCSIGDKYTGARVYVKTDDNANKCNIVVTLHEIAILYYNTKTNPQSLLYDDDGIPSQGYAFCIPDDCRSDEIHAILHKKCSFLPDRGEHVLYDVLSQMHALMHMYVSDPDTADSMHVDDIIMQCICVVEDEIDDHWGMELQQRGCGCEWSGNVRCIPGPRVGLRDIPQPEPDEIDDMEAAIHPRPGM